ncbi:sulfur carrier protein ThiS [Roseburia sp. 499]|uniref:sulfur carrier protein ThiS n=1 Tax=Roseburia sp. 499 TaxID=1261634 RepID=UPI000952017A|nr:sulfur carrier protein ThiS [Roseburia sp. 499]WVK68947.1 sulfur carrier protein ThiS [Roseburia sp. 499]
MKAIIAGVNKEIAEGTTIAKLIVDEKVENAEYVTVTLNEEFLDRAAFETTVIKEGDNIEFLYFMGGGAF